MRHVLVFLMIAAAAAQGCSGDGRGGSPAAAGTGGMSTDGGAGTGGLSSDGGAGTGGAGGMDGAAEAPFIAGGVSTEVTHCDLDYMSGKNKACYEYQIGFSNPSLDCALQGDDPNLGSAHAMFATGPCDTAGTVGGCKITQPLGTEIIYAFPPTKTADWMAACGKDVWIAP